MIHIYTLVSARGAPNTTVDLEALSAVVVVVVVVAVVVVSYPAQMDVSAH